MRKWHATIAPTGLGVLLAGIAVAASAARSPAEQTRLWDDVGRVAQKGPVDVALLDQAVLHLPAGEIFVPQPEADRLLELFGNPGSNPDMPGVILPRDPKASWFMPVHFRATGFIKDDDARTWNADEMLASLKTGTDEQNVERQKAGVAKMEVVGWSEPPRYDAATRRLVWALTSSVVGARPDEPPLVNYNTYTLGREGYFTLNLVASAADLPGLKPVVEQQLAALAWNPGKRYTEFNPGTDRVATYGVGSLVVGITQPRLGFIPFAHALTAQISKIILVSVLVLLAAAVIFWRRKPRPVVAAAPAAPFANTVVETPGRPRPGVDVDPGDDPAGSDPTHRAT